MPESQLPSLVIERDDIRTWRFKQPMQTTTIFVVDASGSSAMNRLAEAKGAVELLLADCYIRRDEVALLIFRGKTAETLLPPTRSLTRAKRCLAHLPGGGGTPLAAGINAAASLADKIRRGGNLPVLVLLTDGQANVMLDGGENRTAAFADAIVSARRFKIQRLGGILIDTSPRPHAKARQLADAAGLRYLPMPFADARQMGTALRGAALDRMAVGQGARIHT